MDNNEFVRLRLRNLHYDLLGIRGSLVALEQEALSEDLSDWVRNMIAAITDAVIISGVVGLSEEWKQ